METTRNEELAPIDLMGAVKAILRAFKRLWWLVLVLAALSGGGSYYSSVWAYRPMYTTSAVLSVSVDSTGQSFSYYYDSIAAEQVVETFPYILNSEVMNERLRQTLGGSLGGSIRAESVADTNLFELIATSSDPQKAYDLVQAVIAVYPQVSASIIGDTQLKIIQDASIPTEAYNRLSWKRSALSGAIKGAMAGLVLVAVCALLRTTVGTADGVKKLVNLSCLSQIPRVSLKARKSSSKAGLLINREYTDAGFREAFHLLRTRLLRSLAKGDKVILFTSSIPAEGKSSIAVNTALSLARDGKKVLLVDGDLRHPSVKALLGLTNESAGLGECLMSDRKEIKFYRYQNTSLYVFAGDVAVKNPTPLFQHGKLRTIFQSLRPMFDYIILDTPPSCMMADATALARHVDKVVYVIREDFATKNQIREGIQALSSEAEICGFVMNMTIRHASGSYGYGYGYGYGHGYGYGKSKKGARKLEE